MNLKYMSIVCIFIIISGISVFANNKNGAKKMITNDILKRRYSEFSTSGAFILVKLQNSKTKEKMDIICENTYWNYTCSNNLKLFKSSNEYTDYMIKNYNKPFEVSDEFYSAHKGSRVGGSYDKYVDVPWETVKTTFLKQTRGFFEIKDRNLEKNIDFVKMLLLHNVVVRRDCYDGSIYIQEPKKGS